MALIRKSETPPLHQSKSNDSELPKRQLPLGQTIDVDVDIDIDAI